MPGFIKNDITINDWKQGPIFLAYSLSDIMVQVIKYIPQFSVGCNRGCFIGYRWNKHYMDFTKV